MFRDWNASIDFVLSPLVSAAQWESICLTVQRKKKILGTRPSLQLLSQVMAGEQVE